MQAFDERLAAEVKQADEAEVRAATAEVCMQCLLAGDVLNPDAQPARLAATAGVRFSLLWRQVSLPSLQPACTAAARPVDGLPKSSTAKQPVMATPAITMASCSLSAGRKLLWWRDWRPKLQGMASELCPLPL